MILTCPNCASRYVVDDANVGPGGRTVRCSNCATSWRAEPPNAPLELARAADVKELTQPARVADLPGAALPNEFRARQQAKKETRQAVAAGVVWGVALVLLLAVLGLAVIFRAQVARVWPQTASLFAGLGLPVNVTGLVIENQLSVRSEENGRPAVRVTGVVRNTTGEPVLPPPMRVDLLDEGGEALVSRSLDLSGGPLAPGRARAFDVTFPDPPESTAESASTFLIGRAAPHG